MFDREQLNTFSAIVKAGSFERAADDLHVSRSAVSQRIKALEDALSTTLLVREKPVIPTAKGDVLLRHIRILENMEADALRSIAPGERGEAPTSIAIAVNSDSLATWFAPLLQILLTKYRIELELVQDDQDHTFRRLARGEVVGCISSTDTTLQSFEAQPLGVMQYVCVAAPAFVRKYFTAGLTVPVACAAPAILFDRKDALHEEFLRQCFGVGIKNYSRHYIPSSFALLNGIVSGLGYGLVPSLQAEPLLRAGGLVEIMPGLTVNVPLYWHHWIQQTPLLRNLSNEIAMQASKSLAQLA